MKYVNITYPDINNGLGCRVTIWLPGCTHNCPGCQNSWMKNYDIGKVFDEETYRGLCKILDNDYIKGITFSGGDPLDQSPEVLQDLSQWIDLIREDWPMKDIWLYTGYYLDDILGGTGEKNKNQMSVIMKCDYLVDGPYDPTRRDISISFRGSDNQRVIKIKQNY